jgi:hypothetical protein
MKRTKTKERTDFEILCDELGEEPIKRLYEAYRLTAAAVFRSAKKRAEAELKMADQYRTLDEEERRDGKR